MSVNAPTNAPDAHDDSGLYELEALLATPRFSPKDLVTIQGVLHRAYTSTIDESTPLGRYIRTLESSVADLEETAADLRQDLLIARDECGRETARADRAELRLDAHLRPSPGRMARPRIKGALDLTP